MTYDTIDNDVTMAGGAAGALGRIDKYELLRELGEGGFGTVYLARDTVADVDVAVKGLPPEVKHNAVELESIRGNFALVKRLRHPNIVAVTDLHQAMSVSYSSKDVESKLRVFERDTMVVMDYAPGVTLAQWRRLFPGGKVPVDKAIAVVRQIASALDYAHAQKVLHRDVKPANVMVESADGGKLVARVLDFGLAAEIRSSMGRLSREIRDTSGTRPYMAPEQWLGHRQGPATDQYALAAMFYELVVGDVPFASVFDCGDTAVMRIAVTTDAPAIPADLPKCVRRALAAALAKKPEDRFATCGEFAAALEGKTVPRRGAETQRKSGGGKVLAVLALAAVIGVGGLVYHQSRERRQAERSRLEAESSKGSIEKAGSAVAQPVETKDAPQPTRKDVDAIYVEARVQMGACGRLDPSDGFKSRIEDCQKSFDFAGAQYDLGRWAEAALAFTNVVGECKTLIEQSIDRDKAKTAADVLADAIKNAQSVGAKEYAPVRFSSATDQANRGRGEFDAFKFADAAATYATAKSQFDLAAKEAGLAKQEEARKKREAEEAAQRAEAERREREAREAAELERKRAEEIEHRRRRLYPQSILPKHGDVKTLILPGGATMEMIYVQPGSFTMGSPLREQGRCGHEIQHRVTLTKGFWLGKYEVTQEQWMSVRGNNPSLYKGDNLPVENVSWNDCYDFVREVNSQLNCRARLPTEAEWEYACRAGTTGAYAGISLDDMGWYVANSGVKEHPVGMKMANGWGFHDMHGNVWEWCEDWYGNYGDGVTDPEGPISGEYRIMRGGSYNSYARGCRSAERGGNPPGGCYYHCGFRLCCSEDVLVGKERITGVDSKTKSVFGVVTDTVDLQSKYDKKLNSSSRACDVDDAGHKGVQLWEGGPYWAETNIGANNPEDYGYYFWWGDNVGYKRVGDAWVASDGFKPGFAFDKNNTPTYGKSADFLMKEGWITTGGFLAPEHDAAHVHWGGNWRMPTYEELRGLTENCDWNWTSVNGVNGYKVQGKGVYASVTIFLPCAGGGGGTTLFYPGSLSNYWSSVPDLDDGAQRAWGLFLARSTGSDSGSMSHINRGDGYSVRPVQGLIKQRAK